MSSDVVWDRVGGAAQVAELRDGLTCLSQQQREAVTLAFG